MDPWEAVSPPSTLALTQPRYCLLPLINLRSSLNLGGRERSGVLYMGISWAAKANTKAPSRPPLYKSLTKSHFPHPTAPLPLQSQALEKSSSSLDSGINRDGFKLHQVQGFVAPGAGPATTNTQGNRQGQGELIDLVLNLGNRVEK